MKFNVFGTEIEALQGKAGWEVFYVGEGGKRPARDIVIPTQITKTELDLYLADIRH
jgi:hypothetical protein